MVSIASATTFLATASMASFVLARITESASADSASAGQNGTCQVSKQTN